MQKCKRAGYCAFCGFVVECESRDGHESPAFHRVSCRRCWTETLWMEPAVIRS